MCVWGWYGTTQRHSSCTQYRRDDTESCQCMAMGRTNTHGNTTTQGQFVKPFKPVSSCTGLVWFQDDPHFHAKWKTMLFHQSQNFSQDINFTVLLWPDNHPYMNQTTICSLLRRKKTQGKQYSQTKLAWSRNYFKFGTIHILRKLQNSGGKRQNKLHVGVQVQRAGLLNIRSSGMWDFCH